MKAFLLTILFLLAFGLSGVAQHSHTVIYKQIDTVALKMEIFFPPEYDKDKSYPAIVFFFGGGWNSGTIKQFEPHAGYFSKRGMVCFLADYRVNTRHHTSPFESLKDAKSAIRFIREHAGDYRIDTTRIVASGGSAGGHLAAALALIKGFNEASDDVSVSCVPDALVLFNPVIDNGPGGYGYDRIGEVYKDFSPLHNIKGGAPPTLFFLGTQDKLIPVETAEYYKKIMERVGSRCDLILFDGESHGFFNYRNPDLYKKTIIETERFLISAGILQGKAF